MLSVSPSDGDALKQLIGAGDTSAAFAAEFCEVPRPPAIQAAFNTAQFAPPQLPLADTFKLHSLPTATKRIYLDFDGHLTTNTIWQNYFRYSDINTPAFSLDSNYTTFSDTEKGAIQDIWARVVEDFLPFQVDVTTEDPGVDGLLNTGGSDNSWGIRVVVGGDGAWAGSAGIAVVGGFGQSDGSPAFVFADQWWKTNPNVVTQCISHEVGHTLGLSHDGSGSTGYYAGHGTGATSWVPIMGSGDKSLVQWSKGEYNGADNKQDDLSIITTTAKNGFGYRADDHGNTTGTATAVSGTAANGIVERNTDVDVFSFASSGTVKVKISPAAVGANLDILAEILDSNGTVLQTSNPIGALDASFNFTATAGTYYLRVQGTGEGDPLSTGYTKYASLGQYTASFEGSSTPPPTLVIAATSADKVEGTGAGTTPFTFTVTRGGDLAASSTVSWAVTGSGTNQASAADFAGSVLPSGSMSFAANEATKTITVNVSADSTVESDEGFTVTLSAPTGATLGTPASATGTIRNDDLPPPSIAIAAASADKAEGTGGGTTPFTFTATRSGDLAGASSVYWAVTGSGGNQASAADFAGSVLPSGSMSFAANEATKTITVNVSADSTVESDEGFTVTLSAPTGATLGTPASATGTIRNDDLPPPSFLIAAASAEKAEGTGGGPTPFTFTVTRAGDLLGASSVYWAVTGSGGSQASAADFAGSVLPSGSVSFAANEATKTITVNVSADAAIESDEGFTVTLASPTGASLGSPDSASGTIRNDDFPPAPMVAIAAASAEKAEGTGGGATPFTFT
ncbi:MAG: Calx-beta domain-containing protein, partial [Planctomycetota bacterium]